MNASTALARKDLYLLLRDKPGFFFTFFFPILYATLFGWIMSGFGDSDRMTGMNIALVDEDDTPGSRAFARTLDESKEFDVQITDRAPAEDLVRRGKKVAYVVLTEGFGEARETLFWGDPAELLVGVDPSRGAEGAMIKGLLTRYGYEKMQQTFGDSEQMSQTIDRAIADIGKDQSMNTVARALLTGYLEHSKTFFKEMPEASGDAEGAMGNWEPIVVRSVDVQRQRFGPTTMYSITFAQAIVWAVMGCSAAFGISLVTERNNGTMERLMMAPLSRRDIMAGKAIACFATTISVSVLLITIGILGFGVRPGSYPLLLLALLCTSGCFVGIMMLLSVLGKTEQSAGGIGWAILMVMAMIGGGMIPQFVMPKSLQQFSIVSPVRWSIQALDGAIWRGYSIGEMLTPCLVLLFIGGICFLVGTRGVSAR